MQRRTRWMVLVVSVAADRPAGCGAGRPGEKGGAVTDALSTGTGLHADYFNNQTLTAPVAVSRTDATVNFNWGTGSPAAGGGVRHFPAGWTGQGEALFRQTYPFFPTSDDGVRLSVNGQSIVNNWT